MPVTIQGYGSLPGVSMTFAMGFLDFVAKGYYWNSSLRLCHLLISIGGKQEPDCLAPYCTFRNAITGVLSSVAFRDLR
jgi:hypothetical protein